MCSAIFNAVKAACHDEFAAVVVFEAVENVVERFLLMIFEVEPSLFIGELFRRLYAQVGPFKWAVFKVAEADDSEFIA